MDDVPPVPLRTPLASVLDAFEQSRSQLLTRLDGLGDDEYFWEPTPNCWNVRADGDGFAADYTPGDPKPSPMTSIAWRMWHITVSCMDSYSGRLFATSGSGMPEFGFVGTAQEGIGLVDAAIANFVDGMAGQGDNIWTALGPDWGPFGHLSRFDLLLHANRELTHHGAEIGLLRDLYLQQSEVD